MRRYPPPTLLFVTALAACGGSQIPTTPDLALTLETTHFEFRYAPRDAASIHATSQALEREHARITGDLSVATMPRVRITFYADQASLAAAVRPLIGDIPTWATGLVTGADRIHMVSLAVTPGPYETRLVDLVHEFAHCVSLAVNPAFANRPRWLWESVAIYEAGQRVDPRTLPYLARHEPPAFLQLDRQDNTLVYEVGFTIGEFVVSRWRLAGLRDLIANNGNTSQTLGVAQAAFEQQWFEFVQQRYGI